MCVCVFACLRLILRCVSLALQNTTTLNFQVIYLSTPLFIHLLPYLSHIFTYLFIYSLFISYLIYQSSNGNIYPSSGNATAADLGIMKSLSSMSSVAKRNLNNLALQFSTKHKQTGDGSTEAERDRLVMDEGVRYDCNLPFYPSLLSFFSV